MAVIKARILPFLLMKTGRVADPGSDAFLTLDTGSVIQIPDPKPLFLIA
jgi:hypothetical protein